MNVEIECDLNEVVSGKERKRFLRVRREKGTVTDEAMIDQCM